MIAPEAANNATKGGALIPAVAFAIPGSLGTAILLSALILQDIRPGPDMLTTDLHITFSMVWMLVIANLAAAGLLMMWSRQVARLAFVPGHLLVPGVIVFVFMGSWLGGLSTIEAWATCFLFGVVGYLMKAGGWARPPLILGLILGTIVENRFLLSMKTYDGVGWLANPIVLIVLALGLITVVLSARGQVRSNARPDGPRTGEGRAKNPLLSFPVSALFFAAFAAAAWAAAGWEAEVGQFPLVMAAPGAVLAAAALLRDTRSLAAGPGSVRRALIGEGARDAVLARSVWFLAWLAATIVVTLVLGQKLALPLFAFAYLLVWGGLRPALCTVYALAVWALLAGFLRPRHTPDVSRTAAGPGARRCLSGLAAPVAGPLTRPAASSEGSKPMTEFLKAPTVERNPNASVPLVALVRFAADAPVAVRLTIDDGRRRRSVVYGPSCDPEKGLPIVGMRADTEHRIAVAADGVDPVMLAYRTPPLPADSAEWPTITVKTARKSEMQPGFTLLSVRRRVNIRQTFMTPPQIRFTTRWGVLMAVDEDGEVVWYYRSDARIAGVHRLANGNLFFQHVDFRSIEMDMTGTVIRMFYASGRPAGPVEGAIPIEAASLHHQPHQMPNGNFLAMTANARTIENYITSETDPDAPRAAQPVVGDRFVEFTPEGEIVWSWDTFDHLDVRRWGYHLLEVYWHNRGFPRHLDWTHGNGITHDPRDDSVIVSLRHQDAIVKIDKASGEIRWILGDHGNWKSPQKEKLLQPAHDLRWHYHGHNPRVTVDGTVVMYDNGICRAQPYDPQAAPHQCFARAVEYEIDETRRTVREVWTSSSDDDPERVISWAMGDAHRLPNDNMLVIDSTCLPTREQLTRNCRVTDLTWNEWKREEWHPNDMPYWARIREMKRDAGREVVFELHLDDSNELVSWQVFGGAQVAALYPPDVEVLSEA